MRLFRWWPFLCSILAFCSILAPLVWCHFVGTQPVWAEAAAQQKAEENATKQDAPKAAEENAKAAPKKAKRQAPAAQPPVIKKRPPLYELPVLKPKQLTKSVPLIVREPVAKTQAEQEPAPKPLPANQRPRPLFWTPRQGGLSMAATYHLNSMGRHVQLTPAMRWYLDRANAGVANAPAGQPLSAAATVPGEGAEKFYPGVSRLPKQKPFANVERPPSGLQRYWPLLLEGREDPNTGLIIWSLP